MAHILNSHQHDTLQLPAHLRGLRMASLSQSMAQPLWIPMLAGALWQLGFDGE